DTVSHDATRADRKETGEGAEERGLAGPGAPEHRDHAPRGKFYVDPSEAEAGDVGDPPLDRPGVHGRSSPRRHGTHPVRSPSRTRKNSTNAMRRKSELTAAASARSPVWKRL